jgi:uncharacterized protein (DUF433 family)
MNLEDYFEEAAPGDIRIKGHRIGIESILYEYLERRRSPEQIARTFPSLELDQIYATILYYLRNREAVDAYLRNLEEHERRMVEEQERSTDPVIVRFRELMATLRKGKDSSE